MVPRWLVLGGQQRPDRALIDEVQCTDQLGGVLYGDALAALAADQLQRPHPLMGWGRLGLGFGLAHGQMLTQSSPASTLLALLNGPHPSGGGSFSHWFWVHHMNPAVWE